MSDEHLDRLATAARSLYVFHYRLAEERRTGVPSRYLEKPAVQWDGGVDRRGREISPVWPRIARAAVGAGADLADFVAAQFALGGEPPRPNHLLSPAAVERWRALRGATARTLAAELEAQHNHLAIAAASRQSILGRGPAAAARGVLRDRTASLSALYRYCVAARTGEDGIAAEFREMALGQLVQGLAGYVAGWRDFLPADLVREAEAIVAGIKGEET